MHLWDFSSVFSKPLQNLQLQNYQMLSFDQRILVDDLFGKHLYNVAHRPLVTLKLHLKKRPPYEDPSFSSLTFGAFPTSSWPVQEAMGIWFFNPFFEKRHLLAIYVRNIQIVHSSILVGPDPHELPLERD